MNKQSTPADRGNLAQVGTLRRAWRNHHPALIVAIVFGVVIIGITILAIFLLRRETTIPLTSNYIDKVVEIELPDGTSNTTDQLDNNTILDVVLANQPAVVRVVALSCGDLSLSSGAIGAQFGHVCAGALGSGSIISSDGHVATNGHVVDITPNMLVQRAAFSSQDNLSKLIIFLKETRKITASQAAALTNSLSSIESLIDNLDTLIDDSMIKVADQTTNYGVQLGNDPLRIDDDLSEISYTETIVPAQLVGTNYDAANAAQAADGQAKFTTSDAALLKIDAGDVNDFPVVELGDTKNLHRDDKVTAIGFPGIIDNGAQTTKWQTIPSISQGVVQRIANNTATNGYTLIYTSAQVGQGSSGGPLFNDDGRQIGLNTYSDLLCLDYSQCLGDATARDIDDIIELAAEHDVTLGSGDVDKTWRAGLAAYKSGDYQTAIDHFQRAGQIYPANYLAPELARMARAQMVGRNGNANDHISWLSAILIISVVIMSLGLTIVIAVIILTVRKRRKHRGL